MATPPERDRTRCRLVGTPELASTSLAGILCETGRDLQALYFAGRKAVRAFSRLSTPTTSLVEVAK